MLPSFLKKRSQVNECAVIIGLDESCLVATALCGRAKQSGLVVYQVIHDTQTKGILIAEKSSANSTRPHYQVRLDVSSSDVVDQFFKKISDARLIPQWIVHCPQRPAPIETLNTTPHDLESIWRIQGLSAFIFGQAAMKAILKNGIGSSEKYSPTIIFVGAIDAVHSQPNFSGFAAVKAGVRALAQSMAREFDPQGVHVAHVVLNDRESEYVIGERFAEAVATTCWQIYAQPKQAWTQELELRSA